MRPCLAPLALALLLATLSPPASVQAGDSTRIRRLSPADVENLGSSSHFSRFVAQSAVSDARIAVCGARETAIRENTALVVKALYRVEAIRHHAERQMKEYEENFARATTMFSQLPGTCLPGGEQVRAEYTRFLEGALAGMRRTGAEAAARQQKPGPTTLDERCEQLTSQLNRKPRPLSRGDRGACSCTESGSPPRYSCKPHQR